MKFRYHFTRGNPFVKLIKLYLMGLFLLFRLADRRIGNYKPPPNVKPTALGYFKRNREISKGEDKKQFERKGRKNTPLDIIKPSSISIVQVESKRLVHKKYEGLQGNLRFYTELTCLHLLKSLSATPKLRFVDYRRQEIYMDLKPGTCLNGASSFDPGVLDSSEKEEIEHSLRDAVRHIHSHGVIIYDVQRDNILVDGLDVYVIDFADSIPAHLIPTAFHAKLFETDIQNLKQSVVSQLYN